MLHHVHTSILQNQYFVLQGMVHFLYFFICLKDQHKKHQTNPLSKFNQ